MIPGLQTHIEGWTRPTELKQIRAFGFRMARIAAMECSEELMREMVRDAVSADLIPFVTVADLTRLPLLAGLDAEWRNEDDGDLSPQTYRAMLNDACRMAAAYNVRRWEPTISNLDRDSLYWLERVRGAGWPAGLHGVSAHRYGDGTFERPHSGFFNRGQEVDRLKRACDGLPWAISEFGYPTLDGLTEAQQAERIGQEWAFWEKEGAYAAMLFQLRDCAGRPRHGIQRWNKTWKPSALSVPGGGE